MELIDKANWKDSDDLEMMFRGTFKTEYYRKLQRFVHKEYRKKQGLRNLQQLIEDPLDSNFAKIKSIAKLGYYFPSAHADMLQLKKLQNDQ